MQTAQFDFRQDFYRYCSLGEHLQSQMHKKAKTITSTRENLPFSSLK